MNSIEQKKDAFERMLIIMDELRAKCPWDQKQTFESLRHLTIEEMYELGDAILDKNMLNIKKELGDVYAPWTQIVQAPGSAQTDKRFIDAISDVRHACS